MDAVVDLLISKVAERLAENANLILGIKDQVEDLLNELRSFKAYLTEAAKNDESCDDNAVLRDVVQKIQKLVSDAEDAIDKYLVERRNHKGSGVMMKRWAEKAAYYTKLNHAAKEIESIRKRAEKLRLDHAHFLHKIQPASQTIPHTPLLQAPVMVEDDVVGLDDEVETIKDRLVGGSDVMTFISIVGMGGSGKTILTKKVFNDPVIHYEFFPCFWIYVSRTVNRRRIFMDIISKFTKQMDDYKDMSEELIAERIQEFLKDEKYFIVMDDVWCTKDWDLLKFAFPNNQKGSRVLVTTRDLKVARHVDSIDSPHNLRFLNNEESWELLRLKVFHKEPCPGYLEPMGRSIAKKCSGFPLVIVVIAGILDKNSTATSWKQVADDPLLFFNWDNQSYIELVRLSYNQLPNHTKDCFLYLAAFPIGQEICVWKLIRLWIAEGFIPSSSNMEGTAKTYLHDIVNRNLLMVVKKRADGEIKTCRLRDILHEFCKSEAMKNNMFHEIDGKRIEANGYSRRLCIRSNVKSFLDSEDKPSGEYIQSFLTSAKLEIPKQHLATIPKSYPLLKVFYAKSFKFDVLPKELYQLYHLRYLAISIDHNVIPKLFSDLWNLQTLVLKTSQSTVEVKAEIWNMPKLRHILANASLQFPAPPSKEKCCWCEELQTLSTMSPKSCTEEIFEKMPNLLKLGVHGDLAELLESKGGICLFDNIQKLYKLENLKLLRDAVSGEGSILLRFPQANKFPRKLRKLSLSKTSFDWKDICVLGSLDHLEVLKLEEFAAKGESWELNNVVFRSLQFLRIGRTDLVYWTAKKTSFPALEKLYLLHCTNLNELPLAFKDVESLKFMELFYTNTKAATSARKIRWEKPKEHGFFELSIYPPYH